MPSPYAEHLLELAQALAHPAQPGDMLAMLHDAHDMVIRAELEEQLARS
jgi:hypothetical protein